jgi:hypothetical protein
MFVVMQRLPMFDNRDAVVGTKVNKACENVYETFGLANYFANEFAEECWYEIDFFVAAAADPRKPVRIECPATADQEMDF